ncbi:MAG TPA: hypothetical protein VK974_05800 [Methylophilaceae bacterium]|nr:hypothetical protein [Methylophilaceae bacterium]
MSPVYKTKSKALLIASLITFSCLATAADMTEIPPSDTTELPNVVPSKHEIAESAFTKLDRGQKGFVSPEDVKVLPEFNKRVFAKVDADHDGKLTREEFKIGWYVYAGTTDSKTRVN